MKNAERVIPAPQHETMNPLIFPASCLGGDEVKGRPRSRDGEFAVLHLLLRTRPAVLIFLERVVFDQVRDVELHQARLCAPALHFFSQWIQQLVYLHGYRTRLGLALALT